LVVESGTPFDQLPAVLQAPGVVPDVQIVSAARAALPATRRPAATVTTARPRTRQGRLRPEQEARAVMNVMSTPGCRSKKEEKRCVVIGMRTDARTHGHAAGRRPGKAGRHGEFEASYR